MPGGTTVTLNEYACAMDGTGQRELPDCMANVRLALPLSIGGPKPAGYVASRVSAIRQGVIATNTSEPAGVVAAATLSNVSALVAANASLFVGCQNSGAGQYFNGTASLCTCAATAP